MGSEFPRSLLPELPRCLDDLIKRNRDLVSVGLATDTEADALIGDIEDTGSSAVLIDRWHLVAFRIHTAGRHSLHIAGWTSAESSIVTSDVVALARDRTRAKSLDRIYRLGEARPGEPDLHLLGQIARALRVWGISRYHKLGVVRLD